MKKSTFIGNFVAWVAVCAVCIAFLAWYHASDAATVEAASHLPHVQLGIILASPFLLYGMGAVLGLLLVRFKRILMGGAARAVCRAFALLALALLALVAVPVLVPSTGDAFLGLSVVVVYVTMAAPILIMVFGFLYALGCAGKDPSKKGPLSRYLPEDDE